MRLREAAGAINAASACFVYVCYSEEPGGGFYLPVTRVQAKRVVEHARGKGVHEIDVEVTAKGHVYIGEEIELADDDDDLEDPTEVDT
jgi:hypothetical protein